MSNPDLTTTLERSMLTVTSALGGRSLRATLERALLRRREARAEQARTREFETALRRWTQG
ncbi:hypothetical protein [Deinococcus pimensis]|uniref:hypothetical protein n=1 Tax=Deinococcus pimensis TaxID=309888 RepID=UPI0004808837|nr:hypothetical protein [Deinococcus pimensis]